MNTIAKKLLLPVIIIVMLSGFWFSPEFQEIAAGVAIFLIGMLMLEDGFRLFSGGFLERILERATRSVTRSLLFGIFSTTVMQSSSLVSVITISFLSAGLISLLAGVGIIFGANLGTTTGAWLVAGFGMKVNIAAYAMPLLAVGVVLVFQSSKYLRGFGYVLAGLGFLFLGIHHMKEGFETFRSAFDLTRLALTGVLGLMVYTLFGTLATVVMQSSHATMVLIITALAANQISYENALALAIGANIGTTITAILGSLTANYQGKRLALAHLVFNLVTAAVALGFISPLREAVEFTSGILGIAEDDFALKLAVFHSLFNSLGIILMLPLLGRLILMVERVIKAPASDLSQPRYLTEAVDEFPATIEIAMQKEVKHLYDNAVELITHGLNLHRHELFAAKDIEALVAKSRKQVEFDIDQRYEWRIKTLYSAILDFATRASSKALPQELVARVYQLRDVAERTVRAVKAVKHLRRNTTHYTIRPQGAITDLYDGLRTDIARILVEVERLERAAPESRSRLWLDDELQHVEITYNQTSARIESLIRGDQISAKVATSFLNDSNYAYDAMRELIEAARGFYVERDSALAEVEQILAIDDDDTDRVA
ncbi:Na/Pi cotransporter family protein [Denitrobaculum tricleocarpae]|uniref:Na/Pi cotransporter family protein n=1 Tax=Denitrobaculum tricleocarpae TaxID=2591009 RepID=A0A545TYC6_9PROT|nr:Na/Pi symporter [Denitrobaculum tricleocarpae]TQV82220.1 Na/Pi cotransporter family protein [Denitrobaculum tricleocarpae]